MVPQPCSTAMRRAGQSSRRAITPRAKRMRAGLGAASGDASAAVAVAVEVDAIMSVGQIFLSFFFLGAYAICGDPLVFVRWLNGRKEVVRKRRPHTIRMMIARSVEKM